MSKRALGVALAVAVVVIVALAALLLFGHHPKAVAASAHPKSTTTTTTQSSSTTTSTTLPASTEDTVEPHVLPTWNLPEPKRIEGVVGVGFPHTTMGAVAMGFGALSALVNIDPSISASVARIAYLDPTSSELTQVAQQIREIRARYGVPPSGPTPTTLALSLDACRIEHAAPDRVVAGYEGELVVEGPGISGDSTAWAKAVELVWDGTDWRISTTARERQPPVAFPGAPGAVRDGWHPCGEG